MSNDERTKLLRFYIQFPPFSVLCHIISITFKYIAIFKQFAEESVKRDNETLSSLFSFFILICARVDCLVYLNNKTRKVLLRQRKTYNPEQLLFSSRARVIAQVERISKQNNSNFASNRTNTLTFSWYLDLLAKLFFLPNSPA